MTKLYAFLQNKPVRNILLFLLLILFSPATLMADPPAKVGRLSRLTGEVSFLAAGLEDWAKATPNRPLTIGDKLWVNDDGYAEVQLGTAKLCIGVRTAVSILNLDNKNAQFQLAEGRLNITVRKISADQNFEIDTPNLAFVITSPGTYRIEVDPDTNTTKIIAYQGQADVYGEKDSYKIDENQFYEFSGTALEYQVLNIQKDSMDDLCFGKENTDQKLQYQYVSEEVVGAEDLHMYGTWRDLESYGPAWIPNKVDADWAPYQYGYWSWIDPWGWTWIDNAEWGFAPFHYGRWVFLESNWAWLPGPITVEPIYAPALVAFINLENSIGWFPLGYNEVYWPAYSYNQNYFININQSNTYLNSVQINNIFSRGFQNQIFINNNARAIRAASAANFANAEVIRPSRQAINRDKLTNAPISMQAPVSPTIKSVMGGNKISPLKPVDKIFDKKTIVKTTPAEQKVPFTKQQEELQKTNGKPINPAELKKLQPTAVPKSRDWINSSTKNPIKIPAKATERPMRQRQEAVPLSKPEQEIKPKAREPVETISKPKQALPPVERLPEAKQRFQKVTPAGVEERARPDVSRQQQRQQPYQQQQPEIQRPMQNERLQNRESNQRMQQEQREQQRQHERMLQQHVERNKQLQQQQLQQQQIERTQQMQQQKLQQQQVDRVQPVERPQQVQQPRQQERIQQQQIERNQQMQQQRMQQQQVERAQQQIQQQRQQERVQQQQIERNQQMQQQRMQQQQVERAQQQIQQQRQQERVQQQQIERTQQMQQQRMQQQQVERAQHQLQQQRQQERMQQQQIERTQQMQQQRMQQQQVERAQQQLQQHRQQERVQPQRLITPPPAQTEQRSPPSPSVVTQPVEREKKRNN